MAKLSFAVPESTLNYMRHRLLRETKRKLIDTLVAEQVSIFEKDLRNKVEALLSDLTIEDIRAAYVAADAFGPKLHLLVAWNSKLIGEESL
jgi:hypothetical protein